MKRFACILLACGIGWCASVYGFSAIMWVGEWLSIQRPLLIPSAPSEIKQRPVVERMKGTLGKVYHYFHPLAIPQHAATVKANVKTASSKF